MGSGHVLKLLHCPQAKIEPMAKEPALPSNRDLREGAQSLFLWGFQRGLVPQTSPKARKPPLRPTLNHPPMEPKTTRLVASGQKASSRGW